MKLKSALTVEQRTSWGRSAKGLLYPCCGCKNMEQLAAFLLFARHGAISPAQSATAIRFCDPFIQDPTLYTVC